MVGPSAARWVSVVTLPRPFALCDSPGVCMAKTNPVPWWARWLPHLPLHVARGLGKAGHERGRSVAPSGLPVAALTPSMLWKGAAFWLRPWALLCSTGRDPPAPPWLLIFLGTWQWLLETWSWMLGCVIISLPGLGDSHAAPSSLA